MIYAYLDRLRGLSEWLGEVGQARLTEASPLSRDEWRELFDKALELYSACGGPTHSLMIMVLERGVKDLFHLVKLHQEAICQRNSAVFPVYEAWFYSIIAQLNRGEKLGLGGSDCPDPVQIVFLLDKLADIASQCQSERMLNRVAQERFPEYDTESRRNYVYQHYHFGD